MNTRKHLWTIVMILALISATLVACGGGGEPPTPTRVPSTPTPAATPTLSAEDHLDLGVEYREQGKPDEAKAEFETAIELEPENAGAHRNLGTIYTEQGQWEEAMAAYQKAIELDPDYGEAYGDMVVACFQLGKLEEAVIAGEKAIELAPNYATGYNNLGVAYKKQGRLEEAMTAWETALEIDPDYGMPHYNMGGFYYNQGNYEEAFAEWEEAARLDPKYADTHKNLGIIYLEWEMAEEAIAEFETYLQLNPNAADREAVENEIARLRTPTVENLLSTPPSPEVVADFAPYQAPSLGLAFQHPADWQVDEQESSVVAASHADLLDGLDEGETGVQVRINATTRQEWGVSGAMEGIQRFVGDMSEDMILDGPSEIEINGQTAVAVMFRMESADVPQSNILAVIEQGERLAVAAATVPLEMEAQMFPTMASVIASIELTESAEAEETDMPPGNTITFNDTLTANGGDEFMVLLGSSGGVLMANVESEAGLDLVVELYDMQEEQTLTQVNEKGPGGAENLLEEVGQGMYKIKVRAADGAAGSYSGTLAGTRAVAFNLLPNFMVAGRLEEGHNLSYTYTGFAGSTLEVLAMPHSDVKNDLFIRIYSMSDLGTTLASVNEAGVDEEERLTYDIPESGVYLVEVGDVTGSSGTYMLAIKE